VLADALYSLGPRDESQRRIELIAQRTSLGGVNPVAHNLVWIVPNDQVLLLQHVNINGSGGGLGNVSNIQLDVLVAPVTSALGAAASTLLNVRNGFGIGTIQAEVDRAFFNVVLPSGFGLRAQVNYSAVGAGANFSMMSVHGLLVPRGSMVYSQLATVQSIA
jgi:hypothetical protein